MLKNTDNCFGASKEALTIYVSLSTQNPVVVRTYIIVNAVFTTYNCVKTAKVHVYSDEAVKASLLDSFMKNPPAIFKYKKNSHNSILNK